MSSNIVAIEPPDADVGFPTDQEAGHQGVPHYGGILDEEFHRDLAGQRGIKVYKEMSENSAAFGAYLWLLESLIGQVPWEMRPSDGREDAESVRQAEWAEGMRRDIGLSNRGGLQTGWGEFISQLVVQSAIYGWAVFEIWWKRRRGDDPVGRFSGERERQRHMSMHDDGLWGIGGLELRPADTLDHWEFDESGRMVAMWQEKPIGASGSAVRIPIEKMVHFRIRPRTNSPEGRSLGRHSYKNYYGACHAEAYELIGIEKDATGMPVMECPPDVTSSKAPPDKKEQFTNAKKTVRHMRRGEYEGVAIPAERYTDSHGVERVTGWKLRPFASGGERQFDIDKTVKRMELRQLQSVLAEFIFLGSDKAGSFALADSKTNTLAKSFGAVIRRVIECFNRQALHPLMIQNGFDKDFLPTLWAGDFETPSMAEFSDAVEKIVGAPIVTPDDRLERWGRERMKMPPHDPNTARERPVAAAPAPAGDAEPEPAADPEPEPDEAT